MIKSPITNSTNVRKIESLDKEKIIKAYEAIGIRKIQRFLGGISNVDIYECLDTHYRFYYPFSIFGDDEFYAYLQRQRKYYADWRWEHGAAFDYIKSEQKVLEIGCGAGNFLEKIKEEKKAECFGLELNQLALKEAVGCGLRVGNQTIQEFAINNRSKFDCVCLFQVLEHVWEVKSFLESASECLKKNGLLIIGVPNNNPHIFQNDKLHALNLPPHHAGIWNKESLKNLERNFNIKLLVMKAEPLFDTNYFWRVKMKHWKEHNKAFYYLAKIIPSRLKKIRNSITQKICDGRNLIAIFSKDGGK